MKPITHIKDLVSDSANARRHTPRNIGVIAESLQTVGAARSIVIDEQNVILAGNGVIDAAGEVGITRLRVIEADGNEIIAVRRSGLTKKQKTQLALADNRANELSGWNPDVVNSLMPDLSEAERGKLGFDAEFLMTLAAPQAPDVFPTVDENLVTEHQCPKCGYQFSGGKAEAEG